MTKRNRRARNDGTSRIESTKVHTYASNVNPLIIPWLEKAKIPKVILSKWLISSLRIHWEIFEITDSLTRHFVQTRKISCKDQALIFCPNITCSYRNGIDRPCKISGWKIEESQNLFTWGSYIFYMWPLLFSISKK